MADFYLSEYSKNSESDSEAVDNCLKYANSFNSRTIIFDKKDWVLEHAVLLQSNTTVIIDNCKVSLADFVFDNIFRGSNIVADPENPSAAPLQCDKTSNIKIIGKGAATLSGPENNAVGYHPILRENQKMVGDFWGWRTHLISVSNCENFEVSNLYITQTCGWAMSFDLCSNGYIHDITFKTNVKNGDGINFRSGCHNCLVERIYGTTSDDTVACTALFREGEVISFPKLSVPRRAEYMHIRQGL